LRIRYAVSALVVIAFLAGLVAPSASAERRHPARRAAVTDGCANANTRATAAPAAVIRVAVVCLVNKQRTSRGLPALRASTLLNRSAQGWTNAMVAGDFFGHGTNFAARITAVGFHWSAAGENIATGFPTPSAVVSAWMASTGHCRNILSPSYADVGTGVSPHPVARYASGPATWTQDFALPMGAAAPSRNWKPADTCPY
jgi:uncharacterized protein YkwD